MFLQLTPSSFIVHCYIAFQANQGAHRAQLHITQQQGYILESTLLGYFADVQISLCVLIQR